MIKNPRKYHKFLKNIKYNDDSMKQYLFNSYGSKCCYCESPLAYFEIEHFYPKGDSKTKSKNSNKNGQFLSIYEISSILKRLIKNKKKYELFENDQRNLHLSCKRCNLYKGMFRGYALSPDFYYDKDKWKVVSQKYLDSRLYYNYAEVRTNYIYIPFIEKLQLNGKNKIGTALLRRRILYLAETLKLLDLCVDLKKENSKSFFSLFKIVTIRFCEKSAYTSMIVNNLGKAFLSIFYTLKLEEKKEILNILGEARCLK